MIIKHFLLCIPGIIISVVCFAQQDKKIDSLLTILKNTKDDTSKVNTLNALSRQFLIMKNVADAKKYAEDALSLAEKKNFTKGIANSHVSSGNVFILQGTFLTTRVNIRRH